MFKYIKHILIWLILVIVGSTAINISSAMDISTGRVKVNTGLPIVTIYTNLDSKGNRIGIDKENWTAAHIEIKDGSNKDYNGYYLSEKIQIKGRGHSSWKLPKKGYSIKLPENTEILGMKAGKDWALVASYSDKTLMRNSIAYDFARSLEQSYVPSYRHVEVYLNDRFLGSYLLIEKIEIDKNRLNINKLNEDDNLNPDITGGYILEIDMRSRVSEDKDRFFPTQYINEYNKLFIYEDGEELPTIVSVVSPSPGKLTDLQFNYIRNYVLEAEKALFSENFTDPEEGYAKYFDVDSFVDWYIINELFKSIDAPMLTSVYMYKDVGGKLTMGPVWDYDLSMGVSGLRLGNETEGLFVGKAAWISRLLEDASFVEKITIRWEEIKDVQVNEIFNNINAKYKYLKKSQKENFKIWNILGRWVWPEPNNIKPRETYDEEVQYLIEWLEKRIKWFDDTYGLPDVETASDDISVAEVN